MKFIRTAEVKFKPTQRIGYIVTARLEKYREETEAWLKRHGIDHGGLHMIDLPTKAARMEKGNRASFKAERYAALTVQLREDGRDKPTELFVESNHGQARKISEITGKAVWCTDTQTFYPAAARLVTLE
jgi:orotate phosphoribosyltransferase